MFYSKRRVNKIFSFHISEDVKNGFQSTGSRRAKFNLREYSNVRSISDACLLLSDLFVYATRLSPATNAFRSLRQPSG